MFGVSEESDAYSTFDKDGIRYLPTSATTAEVTKRIDTSEVVTIPSTVTDDGTSTTYKVTSIKASAFTGESGITKVIIGDNVTSIGSGAFYNCTKLTTATIGSSVTIINFNAFQNCKALTSITIPNTVTSLGSSVFQGCVALTEVNFEQDSALTSIGTYTFSGCEKLESIVIPNSVGTIGQNAFQDCKKLNSVVIGDGVTSLPNYMFEGCIALSNLTIGKSVNDVGYDVFKDCNNIKLTILCSVKSGMFSSQTYFKEVIIEEGVSSIANTAFQYCTSLESVTIKSSTITSIGKETFLGCTSLKTVSIPNSVTTIGEQAFYGCGKLTTVTDVTNVTTIGNGAFQKCEKLVMSIPTSISSIGKKAFEECKGLTSITISGTITTIEEDAFRECTGLETLTIGGNVETIGYAAFYRCTSLETVTFTDTIVTIGLYAFYDCTSLKTVIFPDITGTIGSYAFHGISFYNAGSTDPLEQTAANLKGSTFKRSESTPTEPKLYRAGSSDTQIIHGVTYKLITPVSGGKHVSVIGYDAGSFPSDGNVVIRNQVTFDSTTYNVTEISTNAFNGCTEIISVTIPGSVKIIGEESFESCTSLKTVTIGEGVKNIGYAAFNECPLTYISFPSSLEDIGIEAFKNLTFYDSDGVTQLTETADKLRGSIFEGTDGETLKKSGVPTTFTITYDSNGGSLSPAPKIVNSGDSVTLPDPGTKTGYSFAGWFTSIGTRVGGHGDSYTPQSSITLYAHWTTGETYTVEFVNYDGNVLETHTNLVSGDTVNYGGNIPTRPDDGQYTYTFKGWDPEITAVIGDATYTATYDATPIGDSGSSKGLDVNGQFLLVTFGAVLSLMVLAMIVTKKRP